MVDDNRISRELMQRRLVREGYQVVVTESGQAALEAVQLHPIEMVLCDLHMPDMSGNEVVQELRRQQDPRALPIMIISSSDDIPSMVRSIDLGANDFLTKPVHFSLLSAKMRQLLSLRPRTLVIDPRNEDLPQLGYDPKSGDRIAHYLLQESLGKGGMGEVFRALDQRLLRQVALKLVRDEPKPGVGLQRFLTEARALARVDHPGVVKIYEIGLEPCRFIAMEEVPGQSLQAVPRRPDLFIELLEALEACHLQGIVHRDLKPRNVMVTPDGHVKLMDFGLARTAEIDPMAGDSIYGTPDYMAPEAFDPSLGRVDAQSDLFAVAIMLYENLSGRHPFPSQSLDELVTALRECCPAPIEGLGAGLEQVFARSLCRPKHQRFATAREFAQALRSALGL